MLDPQAQFETNYKSLEIYRRRLERKIDYQFRGVVDTQVVVQKALIKAARAYDPAKVPQEKVPAWVSRIAWNTALDELKTHESTQATETICLREETTPATGTPLGEDPAVLYQRKRRLLVRLNKLEQRQRFVLIQIVFLGRTEQETADRLGLTIDQVRYALKKGAKAYKRLFGHDDKTKAKNRDSASPGLRGAGPNDDATGDGPGQVCPLGPQRKEVDDKDVSETTP
jgi:RNA polymerase sigma factor (sigma-70 family)